MPLAYYNENDKFAARWLRELTEWSAITPGPIDARSIDDVTPADIEGFSRVHMFAGIGVWDYALTQAGWPADRPIWTGSCPCQPFSQAGKREGKDDDRHLWPVWFDLIRNCRPDCVFGEQVASQDGLDWLDTVFVDLEHAGYAVGAGDLCSAGAGAPHIRQRIYFAAVRVADTDSNGNHQITGSSRERPKATQNRRERRSISESIGQGSVVRVADTLQSRRTEGRAKSRDRPIAGGGTVKRVADTDSHGREVKRSSWVHETGTRRHDVTRRGADGRMVNAVCTGARRDSGTDVDPKRKACLRPIGVGSELASSIGRAGPSHGFWDAPDWLFCTDEYWRPVEPGTFPLAAKYPGRVGLLRGYGNAITAELAVLFIQALMEYLGYDDHRY